MLESVQSDPQIPQHVAIIMDGNGRWAKAKGLPRVEGHRRGAEAVKQALESACRRGVRYLTLYAFSVENWNRPKSEVDALMRLLDQFLKTQVVHLKKHQVRLRVIGRISELPENIQNRISEAEAATADYDRCTLSLALNYGSRTEVVDAVRGLAQAAAEGRMDPQTIDYASLSNAMYTKDLPDPDLIIRTSGEIRLSNFLMLQAAYAEIYFTQVLWPDFDATTFDQALADYAGRERRYGKTGDQIQPQAQESH